MHFKNNLTEYKICNSTIGIITDINIEKLEVRVAFNIMGGIVDINIKRDTAIFFVDGKPSSRF